MFRSKETRLELSDSDSDSIINNVGPAQQGSDDKTKTDVDAEMDSESTAIEFNFADSDEPSPSQIYHAALEEFAKLQPLLKIQMDWGDDEPLDDEMKDLLVQVKDKVAVKTRIITGLFDLCLDRLGKIIDTSPLPSIPLSTNSASSATPSKPRHPRKPQPLKKQKLVPNSSNLEMLKTHVFCAEVLKEYYQLVGFRGYVEEADRILQNAFKLLVHFKNDGGVNATIIDQLEELWSDVILSLGDLNIVKYRLNFTSPLLNVLSSHSEESHSSPTYSCMGSYEDPLEGAIFWFGQIASDTYHSPTHSKRSDGQKVPVFRISKRLESLYLFQRDTVHPQLLSQYVNSSSESESELEQNSPSKSNGQPKDHKNIQRQFNGDPPIPIHHQTLHLLFRHLHRAIASHPEEFTTSSFASENNALWGSLLYYMAGLNGNILPDDDSAEREYEINLLSTALEKLSISYEILQLRSSTAVPHTSQIHSHSDDSTIEASSSSNDKAKYVARERTSGDSNRTKERSLNGGGSFDSQDDVHFDSADSAIDSSTETERNLCREENVPPFTSSLGRQSSSYDRGNNSLGVATDASESETEYASQEEDQDGGTLNVLEKWKLQYFPLISQIHLKLSSIHPSEDIVMEHYRSAIHLLQEVLRIDPNNAAVKSQLSQLSAVDEPTFSAQESEPESESETELKVRMPMSRRITRNSKVKTGITIHDSDNDEAHEDAENNESLHSKNEKGVSEEIENSDEEGIASDEDESDSDEEYEFEWEDSSGSSSSEAEEASDNDDESEEAGTASAPGSPSQISSPTLDDDVEEQGGERDTNTEGRDLLTFLEDELEDAERQKRKRRRENGGGSSSGSGIGGGSVAGGEFKKRKGNNL